MEEDRYTRITLRIPKDLVAQIAREAFATSKSQNAEIVARLTASFEGNNALPFPVQQAVEGEMEDKGCTEAEALTNLVLAGQSGGGTVLNLRIAPGTTAKEVHDALSAALKLIPPDSNVISERN
ncbi:hypothetical protein LP416_27895 [Polaromonas sp. P2-4]|nr:hypothetical protein LP416_27895 [Polaromonas sp. P2-4]